MVNFISIPMALKNGFTTGNDGIKLYIEKGNFKLSFNQLYQSGKGYVHGVKLVPTVPAMVNVALAGR